MYTQRCFVVCCYIFENIARKLLFGTASDGAERRMLRSINRSIAKNTQVNEIL